MKKNQGSLFDSDYEGEEFETVDISGDAGADDEEDEWFIDKINNFIYQKSIKFSSLLSHG